jgi:predicted ferric reductase
VWRVAHLALALIAASALVTHVLVVNGYTRAGSLRLLMIAFPAGASAVTLQYLIVRPLRLRRVPWSVVVNRDEGASVRTLRVLPAGHRGFGFDAGQFAWVITGRSPFSLQQHPLSISSSAQRPPDGTIEFSIKALGDWSGATVPALEPGELVWVDGPFGSFVPSIDPTRPLVLIAGGIGIAPMRSILATLRDRGDTRDVTLVYAAHDETRVAYRDQLDELSRLKQITLVYVFEEPDPSWSGARGFVTAALLRQVLGPAAAAADCFVCGPVPMMNAVEKALREIGVPPDSVHTERFQVI